MTARFVCSAFAAGVLASGTIAAAQAQDVAGLPPHGGDVTVVGCVQQGLEHRMVLVQPTTAPVSAVPESACNLPVAEPLLELHDTHEYHFDNSMIGHWVEISGRVENYDKHDRVKDPRELHIRSFRLVPVAPPPPPPEPIATYTPPPAPAPEVYTPPPAPVATTGEKPAELPKSASSLPLVVVTAVMAFMAALAVRLVRGRLAGLY